MPLFTVICHDAPNTLAQRLAIRPRHVARLNALHDAGQVILAGPFPTDHSDTPTGFTGSLLVLDFADRAALDAWLAEEPFLLEGVYSHIDVKPFRQTLP
ncbi:MAG: hypothetical protein RLY58_508 [Pseudomonadota bacterium]|jgi:uncharacterized protein YciI